MNELTIELLQKLCNNNLNSPLSSARVLVLYFTNTALFFANLY